MPSSSWRRSLRRWPASAVQEMAPDDAADLLAELPDERRAQILAGLGVDDRAQLEELMAYPPESAGGIMSPEVTALAENQTVAEAVSTLRRIADESEQLYYTYVVDSENRLVGVLSLRDLMFGRSTQPIRDIMIRDMVSVPVNMDREEVAALLSKYGYLALPVVDANRRLLGIVTVDDVVDVIQEEATEDMHRMVGAGADEHVASPVPLVLRRRIPWLLVNLGTAFLASLVVGLFESTLHRLTALAVLLPVVAGQAGNTGLQSMAVMIRGIATGETRGLGLARILTREVAIGIGTGVLIGLACAIVCLLWARRSAARDSARLGHGGLHAHGHHQRRVGAAAHAAHGLRPGPVSQHHPDDHHGRRRLRHLPGARIAAAGRSQLAPVRSVGCCQTCAPWVSGLRRLTCRFSSLSRAPKSSGLVR